MCDERLSDDTEALVSRISCLEIGGGALTPAVNSVESAGSGVEVVDADGGADAVKGDVDVADGDADAVSLERYAQGRVPYDVDTDVVKGDVGIADGGKGGVGIADGVKGEVDVADGGTDAVSLERYAQGRVPYDVDADDDAADDDAADNDSSDEQLPDLEEAGFVTIEPGGFWLEILDLLRSDPSVHALLSDSSTVQARQNEGIIIVNVTDSFTASLIESEFSGPLKDAAGKVLGRDVVIRVETGGGYEKSNRSKLESLNAFDIVKFE